jgi:hypothetical protein
VGLLGIGADGVARGNQLGGGGGSGGANGTGGEGSGESGLRTINGGRFGGGGGGSGTSFGGGWGGQGAVRIIWGDSRSFPTNAGTFTIITAVVDTSTRSATIGGSVFNLKSANVITNSMPYPEDRPIDRPDQVITVETITDDPLNIKLFAFQNLSAANAGSRSITNSLTGSENFFIAGTGTDGATVLSAYWS